MEYEILELVNQEPEQYQSQYEGIPEYITRQLARTGSRVVETIGGTPRTIMDLVGALSSSTPFGKLGAPIINKSVEIAQNILPSSGDIKEKISQFTQQGYLEPQNTGEEILDAVTEATTGILLGKARIPNMPVSAKGALQSLTNALKTTGLTASAVTAGQAGKFLAQELGAGPLGQEVTNIGMTLLTSAGLNSNINKLVKDTYAIRDNAIRPGDSLAAKPLWDKTNEVRRKFLNVGIEKVKGKEQVADVLNSIENSITANNRMPLNKAVAIKEQMSDAIQSVPKGSKAEKWLVEIRNDLNEKLKNPEITGNKVFSMAQKAGDELYTHVKGANKINDWAKSILESKSALGAGTLGALYGLATSPQKTLGIAGLIGGGYAGYQAQNLMRSILNNPSIRKEYSRLIKAAANENKGQFIKSAERFNKITEPKYEILELV